MGKEKNFRRSRSRRYRNNHWHNIVNKYDYDIEVVSKNLSEEEAIELEMFLIKQYGRKDIGSGVLVNMTDGGEGVFNPSSLSMINRSGKNAWKSKKVKNMDTGCIYTSLSECCMENNLIYGSMKARLRGVTKNKTPYSYIDDLGNPINKYNEDMSQKKIYGVGGKICINIKTMETYVSIGQAALSLRIKRTTLKSDILRKAYNYGVMYMDDFSKTKCLDAIKCNYTFKL